jgi:hypothetical protein
VRAIGIVEDQDLDGRLRGGRDARGRPEGALEPVIDPELENIPKAPTLESPSSKSSESIISGLKSNSELSHSS